MKRCLNCRKTYEENLSECPYCGYKPRSKAITKKLETTQEFEPVGDTKTYKKNKSDKSRNVSATSGYSGSFYLKSGERLNKRYSVLSVMGFGAFGVAYECFDSYNQRNVVVKEYMPSYLVTRSSNGREAEPLSDEAEVTFSIGVDSFMDDSSKLDSNDVECVPKLIESFKQNNTSYVVTELVHGEALSSIIKRKGKLSYHAAITIITAVLQGLRQLNKVGIIHGDICPENIIVTSNSDVYLLDYNLSDFNKNVYTQRDSGKLRAGYSALEMYYMNMEQGPWTDVYAAAATMYKMLTGVTVPSAIKRNTSDTLTPLSKLGIPITQGAEKAMFKALKVDYEKRTKNPEDFLNGLMGDGFDNISVAKEPKHSSYSQEIVPPSRPSASPKKNSGRGDFTNKVLHGILTVLILSIFAVVIWMIISGVIPLPENTFDRFRKDGGDNQDVTSAFNLPDYNDETSSISKFFLRRHESENNLDEEEDEDENENELQEEESSKPLFDLSSLSEQFESKLDNLFSSAEETSSQEEYYENSYIDEYTGEEDGGYYDEEGNYYEEELPTADDEWEETSSQSIGENINDYANSMRERFFN